MKMGKVAGLLLMLISINVLAQDKEGVVKGVKYNITTSNPGPKVKLNDVITFNFTAKTDKDSVLQSSYDAGQPVKVQVIPSGEIVDLMDIFILLAANDVVVAKIPTDSIFKDNEQQRPPYFPKGSFLNYTIKIEKIQSLEEALAERDKIIEGYKTAEKDSLEKYILKNKLTATSTASGLRYIITQPSGKAKPVSGDTVLVNYTGRTLDGKVFDSSIESEAKKAGLEQPGRVYEPISVVVGQGEVIKGWDEALLLINECAKATLLIPSDLGYGMQGNEAIKPFSTLLFDVELVKVMPAKQ
jgi:FKBP-type peptidyl-prolyl cis-trans isomerase